MDRETGGLAAQGQVGLKITRQLRSFGRRTLRCMVNPERPPGDAL